MMYTLVNDTNSMVLATRPTINPRRVRRRRSPWLDESSPPPSPPPPPGTGGGVPPLPRPVLGSLITGSVIVTDELKVAISTRGRGRLARAIVVEPASRRDSS